MFESTFGTPLISREDVEYDAEEWHRLMEEGGRAEAITRMLSPIEVDNDDQKENRVEATATTMSRPPCTNAAMTTRGLHESKSTSSKTQISTTATGTRGKNMLLPPSSQEAPSLQKYAVFLLIFLGNFLVAWLFCAIFLPRLPQ